MTKGELNKMIEEIAKRFGIIGRRQELEEILLAKEIGRPVLIEGPVGVGKTTLAKAVASYFQQKFIRVDGDERFDEYKLVGYFEPQLVLKKGWNWDSFVPGPLTKAMLEGGVLFINEINRLNESAQNVLIPALDEGIIEIPKLGEIQAQDGFWVVATLNPEEYVGVTPIGEALRDRFIWIKLDYQSEEEEVEIACLRAKVPKNIAQLAVTVTRATRRHPDIRRGASVRGAIDLAKLIYIATPNNLTLDKLKRLAIIALGTKIEITEGSERTVEEIISEIVEEIYQKNNFFREKQVIKRNELNIKKASNTISSATSIDQPSFRDDLENTNSHNYQPNIDNDSFEESRTESSTNTTVFLSYATPSGSFLLLRGTLGHYGTQLIRAIKEGLDIRNIISRIDYPLPTDLLEMLTKEAIKYRNFLALASLAQINPYIVAKVLEESLSKIDQTDDINLVHTYYLTKDLLSEKKRRIFARLAKHIIIRKALRIAGKRPIRSGSIRKKTFYRPSLDFDLETTFDIALDKILFENITRWDLIGIERREKRTSGVIVLDISGSMYGEKNVLACLISALTISSLSTDDEVALIAFSDQPYVIKSVRDKGDLSKILDTIFDLKPLGFTNISAALREAAKELKKARLKTRKWVILITDGEYNRGGHPLKWASLLPRLHVIQLGGGTRGTIVCKELSKGRGKYIRVNDINSLLERVRYLLKHPDK
ncbi:MAG: AAA family ATPase [Candidatus Njordarchaeales archaeon]